MRGFKASLRNYALHKGLAMGKLIGEPMDNYCIVVLLDLFLSNEVTHARLHTYKQT